MYSIKEDEAVEVINRIWDMYPSLPDYFTEGLNVVKPFGDARPTTRIEIEHPDGRVSTVSGMPATKKAGHSRVARRVLFDEAAHQEYAREIWKAIVPTVADGGGYVGAVSTANGMSDGQGGGNFFHEVYTGAGGVDYPQVKTRFLKWDFHPERDLHWYENVPLDSNAKAEQYPRDEDEAFLMSGHPFFTMDAIRHYGTKARVDPKFRCEFYVPPNSTTARQRRGDGAIRGLCPARHRFQLRLVNRLSRIFLRDERGRRGHLRWRREVPGRPPLARSHPVLRVLPRR